MKFCEKVKTLREKAGLTQKELALKIGVSLRTVTNYETGDRYPKKRELYKTIAEVLSCPVNYLLSEEEEFISAASESFGVKGEMDAKRILFEAKALFAGGEIPEEDARAFIDELERLYFDSKERAKRFAPKGK